LGVLEARPALLPGDEIGANFHSCASGKANSSTVGSDYLMCGKVAALNLGRKFVREERMKMREGLGERRIVKVSHTHKYAAACFPA
jgi:hypothetical protein